MKKYQFRQWYGRAKADKGPSAKGKPEKKGETKGSSIVGVCLAFERKVGKCRTETMRVVLTTKHVPTRPG